ncbi:MULTISPECIES: choice-of-anchor J domain-containing protein [unclassified Flavobacterium]|uniref:T9SS-dependent choice-of-anchor J family protein n=1 Tax=unclassified Flavobacterium TaxID=196869 RepID=UPI0009686D11|nr:MULTISPECIES: choice-of-anchor J domain-containing protein [unclassified Flavobacterium]MBN9285109.1 choice-of-anchor J domain-containing protein [Flavobacterium sp.]OJV69786.1 MAG: hypothetical protein BGO42_06855 [Flavobacterium sp. 40-81]
MIKKLLYGLVLAPLFSYGQFLQNFDAGTTIPAGWTVANGGDTGTWQIINFSSSTTLTAHSGTNAAGIGYGSTAHDDYLITPAITVTAGVSDFLTFWGRSRDPLYPEVISVKISTTGTAPANFTVVLDPNVAPSSGASFYKYQYDLTPYIGQTIYVGFYSSTTDMFYFDIDDVEVTALPACLAPTNPVVAGITSQTADLSWTAATGNFQVQYGAPGFTAGSGTAAPPVVGATTTTLSGLTANTAYEYYVRRDCGSGTYSAWVGPKAFTTSCASVTAFPFTEGFDNATIPSCWSNETISGTANWTYVTANGNSSITPRTGARMAEFRTTTTGNKTKLVSPPLDLTGVASPQLDFYYANVNWFGDIDELRVYYKTSAGGSWVQLGTDYVTEHTAWTQVTLPLPNPSATYFIAFEGTSNWARGLNLDDVTVSSSLANASFTEAAFRAYPNPVKNALNLAYNETISSVEIYNLLGQKVLAQKVNLSETQIDMSNLSAGNYLVKVYAGDLVKTIKIIKE